MGNVLALTNKMTAKQEKPKQRYRRGRMYTRPTGNAVMKKAIGAWNEKKVRETVCLLFSNCILILYYLYSIHNYA